MKKIWNQENQIWGFHILLWNSLKIFTYLTAAITYMLKDFLLIYQLMSLENHVITVFPKNLFSYQSIGRSIGIAQKLSYNPYIIAF